MAAEIASLRARLAEKDEQEKRNELRFQAERRYVREQAFDNRVSLGETLQIPVSAIKPTAAQQQQTAQRRLRLEQQRGDEERGRKHTEERARVDEEDRVQLVDDVTAMERALKIVGRFLPKFYGNSERDKDNDLTVDDFVTKVESALADVLPSNPGARLSVIRMCLQDDALDWFNSRMEELIEAGIERPDWQKDMRAAFIDAYNPRNTYALRVLELKSLRLGVAPTKTPAELAARFDSIVRRMYPGVKTSRVDHDQRLAGDYAEIICNSDEQMWNRILRSGTAVTLQQWKLAVAQQWHAEELIRQREASTSSRSAAPQTSQRRVVTSGKGDEASEEGEKAETVNAMRSDRTGSSGGRGGRGGGSLRSRLDLSTAERRQRYIDGQCVECGKTGHIAKDCRAAGRK